MNRWRPVIGGMLLNLALGAFYAWSVFVLPLEKEFRWSRQQTSWVFTIAVIATAASFVVGGRIQDTRGPRLCGVIGATLVGLGFSLASLTMSLSLLYAAFGLVVGIGNGIGYAAPMPVASKWFPDKRGLAVGLTVAGYGAGSAIIGPLATNLIDQVGWRVTFRILGLVLFGVGLTGEVRLNVTMTWNISFTVRVPRGAVSQATIDLTALDAGISAEYAVQHSGNGVYVFVLSGEVTINGEKLHPRDGLGVTDAASLNPKGNEIGPNFVRVLQQAIQQKP